MNALAQSTPLSISDDSRESLRLDAVRSCNVLDTEPEQVYNDVVRLVARLFDMPVALVSIVDQHRQWFKARVGIAASQTPREVSFCAHAIRQRTPLIVQDARQDPRFAENPLVTGPANIRFYAGAPLISADGFALGALCAIDHQPRVFSPDDVATLEALARQVVAQLELRRVTAELGDALRHVRTLQGFLPICAQCRRLREDDSYWELLRTYLDAHPDPQFAGGVCPACRVSDRG